MGPSKGEEQGTYETPDALDIEWQQQIDAADEPPEDKKEDNENGRETVNKEDTDLRLWIKDNGSVGDVTTNIDLITQDAAITSGRFCRMRTTLSGTTTRTLIQAQGLVGDTTSEVILTASDAVNLGEESKILLSGLTGDIKMTGTGMGTLEVGDPTRELRLRADYCANVGMCAQGNFDEISHQSLSHTGF